MVINHVSYSSRKYILKLIFLSVISLSSYSSLYGNEDDIFNEDDLFSEFETVVEKGEIVDESITMETDKTSISLSGSIYNNNYYSTVRDDFILNNQFTDNDDEYTGSLTANLLLDMRYKDGIKGFVNADTIYNFRGVNELGKTDKTYTDLAFREYFFDFNVKRKVYFRIGRQYLKWGRNFWNPTDLINVEKKDFLDPDKNLQGTRGIKIHVPFGSSYNIYGFINIEDLGSFDDIAWSGKFEFLVGSTEMAFSGWYKKGFEPVFGYDFSTRLFRIDWQGEISVSRGENQDSLLCEVGDLGNTYCTTTRRKDIWFPKASLGFTKTFDLMDSNRRVTIRGELYYNRAGYKDNVFENSASLLPLLQSNLYETNHVSRFYASFLASIQRFILSDASFSLNMITNLTDGSGIIYSSFRYNQTYDFSIELAASVAVGDGRDEYTFHGRDTTVGLEFRYNF